MEICRGELALVGAVLVAGQNLDFSLPWLAWGFVIVVREVFVCYGVL